MQKVILTIVILTALASSLLALDKSIFDLPDSLSLRKSTGVYSYASQMVRRAISEVSMISGGYFTVGTANGASVSYMDDHCGLTFGHPYAMTSYPIVAIDGTWQKLDDLCSDMLIKGPQVNLDTLTVAFTTAQHIATSFSITSVDQGRALEFQLLLRNSDVAAHTLGLGLVLDPALGQWGDGTVYTLQGALQESQVLVGHQISSSYQIWERGAIELSSGSLAPKGMGMTINFISPKPDDLIIANWSDIYNDPSPTFSTNLYQQLYDLTVKMIWPEIRVDPNDEVAFKLQLEIIPPDFSSNVFMRWDMPSFLSTENSVLFPQEIGSQLQINNRTNDARHQLSFSIELPPEIKSPGISHAVSVMPNQLQYVSLPLNVSEIYEEEIVTATVTCSDQSGNVIDKISRNIYIPATPVSDTGLIVSIDSLITDNYPNIGLLFGVQVEETGQKVLQLQKQNIFLYENDLRIEEFDVVRDTSGGALAADIVFVLDVTGSMGDEIAKVKNNILEFADSLNTRGIDYQLGLVTFLDVIENVYPFTKSAQLFKNWVSQQQAHGGGDGPENSLGALKTASDFSFRSNARRIFIWITDADYHETDGVTHLSKQQVIDQLLVKDIIVHAIGPQGFKSHFYDPIIIATGGNFYDIYGNFRDILLDISRLRGSWRNLLTFTSQNAVQGLNRITLNIHFAGLGGSTEIGFTPPTVLLYKRLSCYPNPFNPQIKISISEGSNSKGEIAIYNLLGERVKQFNLSRYSEHEIIWNATDEADRPVSAGFYLVQLSLQSPAGRIHRETQKILYLK